MTEFNLHVFNAESDLSIAAAEFIARLSAEAIARCGRFTVAFSGGSLPKLVCSPLLASPLREKIDWHNWHVFFADERCVPLDSEESNYRLLREFLLDHVPVSPENVAAINPALSPQDAAADYQIRLANVFRPAGGELPRFDLILLGMGDDGHTASLFPGHPLLTETELRVAAITDSPKPPPRRITLTLPVINAARQVAFVTTGASKATVLTRVLYGPPNVFPAQMVQPADGELSWFVDQTAHP